MLLLQYHNWSMILMKNAEFLKKGGGGEESWNNSTHCGQWAVSLDGKESLFMWAITVDVPCHFQVGINCEKVSPHQWRHFSVNITCVYIKRLADAKTSRVCLFLRAYRGANTDVTKSRRREVLRPRPTPPHLKRQQDAAGHLREVSPRETNQLTTRGWRTLCRPLPQNLWWENAQAHRKRQRYLWHIGIPRKAAKHVLFSTGY